MAISWKMHVILMSVSLALCSCASMAHGNHEDVSLLTNPEGARCVVKNTNGSFYGSIIKTPGAVNVERTKYDLEVDCSLAGYQDTKVTIPRKAVHYVGGGTATLMSLAIDGPTGADNYYQTPYFIGMQKAE